MATITLIRSAIRGLLRVADAELAARRQPVIPCGDDQPVRQSRSSTDRTPPRGKR